MKTNKTFGVMDGKTSHTPFHQVHMSQSGEIVNELNVPICSVEIDELPKKTREDNAAVIIRCLNGYDYLLQAVILAERELSGHGSPRSALTTLRDAITKTADV